MAKRPEKSTKVTRLRKPTEELLRMTKRDVAAMPVEDLQQLVHELQVHQIELDLQNEELRRTQVELETARERYVDLYDFSPVGYLTLDTQGKIVEANRGAGTLLGINRGKLIGQTLSRFVESSDQDTLHRHCQNVLKTGARESCEVRLREEAGACACVHLESVAVHDVLGHITHWRTTLLDISDRKVAEDGLRLTKFSVDRAADAIYWIDPQAKILNVNEAASRMLGYSKDELCAMTLHDLSPDFQADKWPGFWAETRRRGTMVVETAHRAKNGRLIFVEVSINYLFHEGKEYHCAFAHDITQRKQLETEMQVHRDRLAFLLSSTPTVIYSAQTTSAYGATFVSANAMQVLGYRPDEFTSDARFWANRIHPDDQARVFANLQQLFACGTHTHEYRFRHQDGTYRWMRDDIQLVRNAAGDPIEMVGSWIDITERKQAEEELRRSEAFITSMLENLPNMIFVKEAQDLKFVRFNKAAEDLLGYSREALIGKNDYDFFSKAEADFFTENDRQVLKSGRLMDIPEESIQTRSKGERILHTKKIPIVDAAGTPQYLLGISEDITEHKRLEAQFRQAQKMEAVGRLAGGVAHDFNNLLTVMNGYSALLLDQLSPEDPRYEMAAETLKAGERAGELTKQLLAFSRKQILRPQPLDLNDSLGSISSLFSRLLGDNIALTLALEPNLWTINGDKGQLDQVTMNLAINARDAMPNGGTLTITTRNLSVTPERPDRHRIMPPGDYVHLSVRDSGHGMNPETLSHLFEPFFTTKEVGKGTGLGLATIYGIVKQSEGYIFADSALEQGTTFHLYYPRVLASPAVAATPSARRTAGMETVLVVEDQDLVRAFIVQALNWAGYRVSAAANGKEALKLASTLPEPVKILITDVVMPHMAGPELAKQLRCLWPGLRVLFMSGYSDQIKPALLDEPGTAFIQKPFLPDALAKHLGDLLDRSI
jgi:PAS domain S-box-containing protein